jgi:exodeoxyribonuclease V gamma subunit
MKSETKPGKTGLEAFTSNRMEVLLDRLAGVVSEPLPSPLDKEIIVVQSRGLERWLGQELAIRLGIWANASFPFPNAILRRIFEAYFGRQPEGSLFAPEVLAWRIHRVLNAVCGRNGFEALADYVAGEETGLKKLQLSRKVADVFDQYTLYRPDWVLAWEEGREDHWQARLWRELTADCPEKHRAALRRDILALLDGDQPPATPLPARISVFGIPALPPFHLEILRAISRRVRICLFLLTPCRDAGSSSGDGRNPLLSSLGTQGQQFLTRLEDRSGSRRGSEYRDPGERTLLSCIQSDVCHNRDRSRSSQTVVADADRSVQIHSVHSPLREMEVLQDYLLSSFDEMDGLEPRDILVMTPQIETYAPFISAVFGTAEDDRRRIPFSIADRNPRSESLVIQAFLKLLGLCRGRFGASEVMDLLACPPVQGRFGIESADLDTIAGWLEGAGIRWGIDGEHRARCGVPAFDQNSWLEGLKRLLLGYALPAQHDRMFASVLPFDDVEGSDTQVLGRLAEFAFTLFDHVTSLEEPRTPQEWRNTLLALMDRFISADEESERDAQAVRSQLHAFATAAELGGFSDTIAIEGVRDYLEDRLPGESWNQGFLTGGVTFCEMLPMRSIPFRVIALVGMDSTAFPRQGTSPGFDLMKKQPRSGDRSAREEDRYLFLEALVSARERLYISYVGQSVKDNTAIPPAAPVNELLDAIDQGFTAAPPHASVRDQLVVRDRLQAFSPAYFSGRERLFSYSQDNLEALYARLGGPGEPRPFVTSPCPGMGEEFGTVDLRELKRFFRHPVEYFLRHGLGIRLEQAADPAEDCEPFRLDALTLYSVRQEIAEALLAGGDVAALQVVLKSRGVLPPGTAGDVVYLQAVADARRFERIVRGYLRPTARSLELGLQVAGFELMGNVGGCRDRVLVRYRCASIKPKDQLAAWLDHLAWNAAAPADPVDTVLLGFDQTYRFRRPGDSVQILSGLLQIYRGGLREPAGFFPVSSLAYAEAIRKQRERGEALEAARRQWTCRRRDDCKAGEGDDPYYRMLYGDADPLGESFERLADAVLGPLLQHREKA